MPYFLKLRVDMQAIKTFYNLFFISKYTLLLMSLILLIIIAPYHQDILMVSWGLSLFTLLIFITALKLTLHKKARFIFMLMIAIFSMGFSIMDNFSSAFIYEFLYRLSFLFFMVFAILIFSKEIFTKSQITKDILFGSICVYLMIGLSYAMIYIILEMFFPGAFVHNSVLSQAKILDTDLYYFSFTTLTTVGFGDIIAASQAAKTIVILESITGIFYLALLVSSLLNHNFHKN